MSKWFVPMMFLLAGCSAAAPAPRADAAVVLHGQRFTVELATDDASRQRGLMMRSALAADHGMLFVFPQMRPQGFWMKNTLIPLDILYFDAARQLVSMQQDVPPCEADPCPVYPSEGPAIYVLELPAGTAARVGIQPGDVLNIDAEVGTVR